MAEINGTAESEELYGTSGNDVIFGNLGEDTLDGGGGSDEFVFNNYITSFPSGNSDLNVISTDGFDIIKNYFLGDIISNIDANTGNSKHVDVDVGGILPGEASVEKSGKPKRQKGTKNSDVRYGTSKDDIIYGLSGDDTLYGNEGYNRLYGGTGNDSLDGGTGFNFNELYGEEGNDYLSGGDYGNKMYGGVGNDTLDGSRGSKDTLIGGSGDDTYILDYAIYTTYTIGDTYLEVKKGDTSPIIKYKTSPMMKSEQEIEFENDIIKEYPNQGTDTVESPVSFILSNNLENLVLTGSNDINGSGNDLNNQIDGNTGKNFLIGGDGDDELHGYGDDDILAGGAGKDRLTGGFGNDLLYGSSESDTLIGGAGNDTLNGGAGDDILTGGSGADTFVFSSPFDGIDSITDFNWQEGDKIQISGKGFGIEQDDYENFIFDSSTNELWFEQIVTGENTSSSSLSVLASLQPGSNFNPSLDIDIVSPNTALSISATA